MSNLKSPIVISRGCSFLTLRAHNGPFGELVWEGHPRVCRAGRRKGPRYDLWPRRVRLLLEQACCLDAVEADQRDTRMLREEDAKVVRLGTSNRGIEAPRAMRRGTDVPKRHSSLDQPARSFVIA